MLKRGAPKLRAVLDKNGKQVRDKRGNPVSEVSSPRDPPPKALSEPDVNLSAHPAPIIQPPVIFQISSVQTI